MDKTGYAYDNSVLITLRNGITFNSRFADSETSVISGVIITEVVVVMKQYLRKKHVDFDGVFNNVTSFNSGDALEIPPSTKSPTDKEIIEMLTTIQEKINTIPVDQRYQWAKDCTTKAVGHRLPESLLGLYAASTLYGDTGNRMDIKPDWLDLEKFRRGQKFATNNLVALFYSNLISLFMIYSFNNDFKTMLFTGNSSTPYACFKRYLSTASKLYNWYTYDVWTPGNPGYDDICAVRKIHALIRQKISSSSDEEYCTKTQIKNPWCPTFNIIRSDFQSTCPAQTPSQCPYLINNKYHRPMNKILNQAEMAATQFSFIALVILYPEAFGMANATDDDLEALCHVWRGLGYLLGIDDKVNVCRGSLKNIKNRSREFIEFWVKPNFSNITPEWEHVMRCLIHSLGYYYPRLNFEIALCDMADILQLDVPKFYSTLSYIDVLKRFGLRTFFNHLYKIHAIRVYANDIMVRALMKAQQFDEKKHKELQEMSAKKLQDQMPRDSVQSHLRQQIAIRILMIKQICLKNLYYVNGVVERIGNIIYRFIFENVIVEKH